MDGRYFYINIPVFYYKGISPYRSSWANWIIRSLRSTSGVQKTGRDGSFEFEILSHRTCIWNVTIYYYIYISKHIIHIYIEYYIIHIYYKYIYFLWITQNPHNFQNRCPYDTKICNLIQIKLSTSSRLFFILIGSLLSHTCYI